MVDNHCACRQALQCAVFPDQDFAYVIIIADATEDDIHVAGNLKWRQRHTARVLVTPGFGFRSRAIVDYYIVAAAREEAGHGVAHDA
jgi:hypothetical protein